jgi:hypothetical protein
MRADALDALVQVREGAPLGSALAAKKRFPGLLAMFARLGEQTGKMPEMLSRAAVQLSTDVQRRAMALATLLEPLLIVGMGVVVPKGHPAVDVSTPDALRATMLAASLVERCLQRYSLEGSVIATAKGQALQGLVFRHPLHDVPSPAGVCTSRSSRPTGAASMRKRSSAR